MSTFGLTIIDLDPAEAVTLSVQIHTAVESAVKEHKVETIGQPIIDANKELQAAAEPLRNASTTSGQAKRDIDIKSDNVNGGLHDGLMHFIRAYDHAHVSLDSKQQAHRDKLEAVLQALFPHGKTYLKGRRKTQFGTNDIMLKNIDEDKGLQKQIKDLGLEPLLDLARSTHKEYGIRYGYTTTQQLSDKEKWETAIERYIARVMGLHARNSPLRGLLLQPYIDFEQHLRQQRRAQEAAKKEKQTT